MAKNSIISTLVQKERKIDFPLKKVLMFSFAVNIITIVIVLIIQPHLPPQVPLFYGLAEGEEQLTFSLGLVIPAFFSLLVSIINMSLTLIFKNDFLQKTLILASFAVSVFSVITTVKIILLVGSF